jgi:cyclic pyranopterin phosphate synthase
VAEHKIKHLKLSAMNELTHTDKKGKAVMVDVGDKVNQKRIAKAAGHILLSADTLDLIRDNLMK